mmetsp:Transcript_7060/g.10404  ORF Transcript_7060/g.10404 Transcript_7060/m.10404 type:complete len:242 (+) Transcript_7060:711-1436(+)
MPWSPHKEFRKFMKPYLVACLNKLESMDSIEFISIGAEALPECKDEYLRLSKNHLDQLGDTKVEFIIRILRPNLNFRVFNFILNHLGTPTNTALINAAKMLSTETPKHEIEEFLCHLSKATPEICSEYLFREALRNLWQLIKLHGLVNKSYKFLRILRTYLETKNNNWSFEKGVLIANILGETKMLTSRLCFTMVKRGFENPGSWKLIKIASTEMLKEAVAEKVIVTKELFEEDLIKQINN